MKNLDRIENHAKYVLQILVAWFTFFVTINWASLGWLAANSSEVTATSLVIRVSQIFAWQNCLGVITCVIALFYFHSVRNRIIAVCAESEDQSFLASDFPWQVYIFGVIGMILGIVPLGALWWFVPKFLASGPI